ncbi:hypothetical protein GUJ93_ZPchr0011g28383 [Zizania palustris]|uniref:Uncharacterized protein n=1 Tax=Zizania palustris TaxID=103762 RepID=A0A8J5WIP0_ZIZPA|nr:hypothetical protein GUJ93_ZPchr0011g28383 [Zizania palustris]
MSQRGAREETWPIQQLQRPPRSRVGGADKGYGEPSGQSPLSSNRSFRKPGNGHGVYPRVVNQPDTTGF